MLPGIFPVALISPGVLMSIMVIGVPLSISCFSSSADMWLVVVLLEDCPEVQEMNARKKNAKIV